MRKLTIKTRITLLCALLAAVVAAFALAVVLGNEQWLIRNYYRDSLVSTAQLAVDDIRVEDGDLEIDRNLDELPTVRVAMFTQEGDLIYGKQRFELEFVPDRVRETASASGGGWYVYDTLLTFEGHESVWLRCYMSAGVAEGMKGVRTEILLMLLPGLVLLAGVGGYGIARRAFRPVEQIRRTAEGIADGADLKKRIGLTGARDEIYRLARVFDDMLERLDKAFERERRFTSDVSHELRTPVAAIMAQSDFALSEDAGAADRIEALQSIQASSRHLSTLIQRLLTLARMDARQVPVEREEIDLGMLAEITAQSLEEKAAEKGVAVVVQVAGEAIVSGDQTMIMQAALNLAENAIRYGREGGNVRIRVEVRGAEARLCVEDDGRGISEEDLPKIFDRFYQVDKSRHGEGAGLGLSLVQRIMQLHGGRVEVQSRLGEGSRFTLIFAEEGDER